jgi:hypothetical protein
MKEFIAHAIIYLFSFIIGAGLFLIASAVCGLFIGHGWGIEAVKAGAPLLTGCLLVTAIIIWALKTTIPTS